MLVELSSVDFTYLLT